MSLRKESKQRVDRIRVDYSDLSDGVTVNYEPTIKAGGIVTSVFYDVLEEFWEVPTLGSELVTNGGFSSTSDWSTPSGGWSWISLNTSMRITTSYYSPLNQVQFVNAGTTYYVSYKTATFAGSGSADIIISLAGATSAVIPVSAQGVTHGVYLTAVNSGGISYPDCLTISAQFTGGVPYYEIEDVSMKEVTGYEGTGTISIGLEDQDDDIFTSDMSGVTFETGIRQGSGTGMVGSGALLPFSIKTTADRQLAVRWDKGAEDLQAGKMDVYIVWNEGKTT